METITLPQIYKLPNKVNLPASKSISNRLLILNELSDNKTIIENLSNADDTTILKNVLDELKSNKEYYIFNLKNAGTTMRFLTAFLSQRKGKYELNCDERMKKRPIGELVEALKKLNANISYIENENYPPIVIIGNELCGKPLEISAKHSSQFVSALLMIAPKLKNGITLKLIDEINSFSYIKMTLSLLENFGIKYKYINNVCSIKKQNFSPPEKITVESDWSASAVWFAFVSLIEKSEIILPGLNRNSIQGDSKLPSIYKKLGVDTSFKNNEIKIKNKKVNYPDFFEINLKDTPDIAPTLIVNLCLLDIKFSITGVENLKIKESNRNRAIIDILENFGYILTQSDENKIEWNGAKKEKKTNSLIKTYNDHRMAMAASLFLTKNSVTIDNPKCVEKSYPKFFEQLIQTF